MARKKFTLPDMPLIEEARFSIGNVVRHRLFDFRGVVIDIDPVFANSEEWYQSIPVDIRPHKDQPYYHLFAEDGDEGYTAYVSQQNLVSDGEAGPVDHPELAHLFADFDNGQYTLRPRSFH